MSLPVAAPIAGGIYVSLVAPGRNVSLVAAPVAGNICLSRSFPCSRGNICLSSHCPSSGGNICLSSHRPCSRGIYVSDLSGSWGRKRLGCRSQTRRERNLESTKKVLKSGHSIPSSLPTLLLEHTGKVCPLKTD